MAKSRARRDTKRSRDDDLPAEFVFLVNQLTDRFRHHLSHFMAEQFDQRLSAARTERPSLHGSALLYAIDQVLAEEESLQMVELLVGEVVASSAESVTVLYHDQRDDEIEHRYVTTQFVDNRLPLVGQCLECGVFVVRSEKLKHLTESEADDNPRERPDPTNGPLEF